MIHKILKWLGYEPQYCYINKSGMLRLLSEVKEQPNLAKERIYLTHWKRVH